MIRARDHRWVYIEPCNNCTTPNQFQHGPVATSNKVSGNWVDKFEKTAAAPMHR
jgi:hypothetical protein